MKVLYTWKCFPGLNSIYIFLQSFIKIIYIFIYKSLYPPLKLSFAADVIKASRSPSPSRPLTPPLLIQAPADRNQVIFRVFYVKISSCRNKIGCQWHPDWLHPLLTSLSVWIPLHLCSVAGRLCVWGLYLSAGVWRTLINVSTALAAGRRIYLSVGFSQTLCSNSRSLKPRSLRIEL